MIYPEAAEVFAIKYVNDCIDEIIDRVNRSDRIFLFLDYDGTLTRFRREPEDARPSERIKKIILKLTRDPDIKITIVSGRVLSSLIDLFEDFDHSGINWSGAHGIQIQFEEGVPAEPGRAASVLPVILALKEEISDITALYPCYRLEDKGISFALHYRKCPDKALALLVTIKQLLNKYQQDKSIEVLYMKKVIEIKPAAVNKGNTVQAVIKKYDNPGNFINICMGDDVTDEYLFVANPGGINIKIGKEENICSAAEYYLKGVGDVFRFLKKLSDRHRRS